MPKTGKRVGEVIKLGYMKKIYLLLLFSTLTQLIIAQVPLVKQSEFRKTQKILPQKKLFAAASKRTKINGHDTTINVPEHNEIITPNDFYDYEILRIQKDSTVIVAQKNDKLKQCADSKLTAAQIDALQKDAAVLDLTISKMSDSIFSSRVYQYASILNGTTGKFLPTGWGGYTSEGFYKFAYGLNDFNLLTNVSFQADGNNSLLYAEIASGVIGPFRMGFSTLVSNSKDTVSISAEKQKFTTSGGNVIFNIQLPVFYINTPNSFTYLQLIIPSLSGSIPILGSGTQQSTGDLSLGASLYQDISTNNKAINVFATLKCVWIQGFTDSYYSNLGIKKTPFLEFPYGTLAFGITIASNFRVSFSLPIIAPTGSLKAVPMLYGVQALPVVKP